MLDVKQGARAATCLVGALVATAVLIWLLHRALKVRYDLHYLWPAEHATLAAVADAILTEPRLTPEEIATRVDNYWAELDIGYKWRLRLSLWLVCLVPLIFLRPPLPLMERAARRAFVERRYIIDVATRSGLGPLRTAIQSAIRFAMQMVYLGYYDDRRRYAQTGYTRFSDRPDYPGPPRPAPPLRTLAPSRAERRLKAGVLVIGSGAGGSIAAHVLAERGRDALMVDRGRHVRPQDFTEDEAAQYASLYSDGALQISRDFSFQVLQGMCVGAAAPSSTTASALTSLTRCSPTGTDRSSTRGCRRTSWSARSTPFGG